MGQLFEGRDPEECATVYSILFSVCFNVRAYRETGHRRVADAALFMGPCAEKSFEWLGHTGDYGVRVLAGLEYDSRVFQWERRCYGLFDVYAS